MSTLAALPRYDISRTYDWNYEHAPEPVDVVVPKVSGAWRWLGLPVDSPLGIAAGPLLNGRWCLYYASLGFDVLTYKTVRSHERACYPLPNLQPVLCGQLQGDETETTASESPQPSWAVSFGMPSKSPDVWRADVEATRKQLPRGKLLSVSVVGTVQPEWTIDNLAADYALCAKWAVESGADVVETNFSCPNVSTCDGQLYQQPNDARCVAEVVRGAIGRTPLVVKIGHVRECAAADELLAALGPAIHGLAMTNSVATRVRCGDVLLFDGQPRGICGDAIRDSSLAQVRMFGERVRAAGLPVECIGVGGINSVEHVRDYLAAGASACHLASAVMQNPGCGLRIRQGLG